MKSGTTKSFLKKPVERNLDWYMEVTKTITDGLGHPIDNSIINLIALLNYRKIVTTGSCEGHSDWGNGYPWVSIKNSSVNTLLKTVGKKFMYDNFNLEVYNYGELVMITPIIKELDKGREVFKNLEIKLGLSK